MRVVVLAFVLCASSAVATAGGRLDYERRDDGCPDRAELLQMVEARLGYDPMARDVEFHVRVTLEARRASIQIVEGGQTVGERTVRAETSGCQELARAAALAVAIAIEPGLAFRTPEPEPSEPIGVLSVLPVDGAPQLARAVPETGAVAGAGEAEPEPSREALAVEPIDVYMGVGVVAAVGAAPKPGAGATVQLGARRAALSLDLEARFDRSSHVVVGPGRVHASLRFAALVPCGHRAGLAVCGVVAAGVLRGRGENLDDAAEVSTAFLGGGARLGYELAVSEAISVRVYADVLGAVARTALEVDDMEVWTLPPWSAAVGFSAVGHFR